MRARATARCDGRREETKGRSATMSGFAALVAPELSCRSCGTSVEDACVHPGAVAGRENRSVDADCSLALADLSWERDAEGSGRAWKHFRAAGPTFGGASSRISKRGSLASRRLDNYR